eukprot:TRINITY_DN3297_c0_g1_i3.p1 TRINITY_DN3297_c0_g1~~TRINITY_DN3297_c0_g1_i3.p1  ORF type:complete len:841 (-),score=151.69 TRINITY_DN3297_c0_g1_i3:3-2525(-)
MNEKSANIEKEKNSVENESKQNWKRDENCCSCEFDEEGNVWIGSVNVGGQNSADSLNVLLGSQFTIEVASVRNSNPNLAKTNQRKSGRRMSVINDICKIFDPVELPLHLAGIRPNRDFIGSSFSSFSLLLHFKFDEPPHSLSLSKDMKRENLCCFISTPRKGHVVEIAKDSEDKSRLLHTYMYTNETTSAQLTGLFLYLATQSGLETWTTRTANFYSLQQKQEKDLEEINRRSETEYSNLFPSPCLVGLQPYIGLSTIAVSGEILLLFSKVRGENGMMKGWNLYSLHHTPLVAFYGGIIKKAENYLESNPGVYLQLVLEAHILVSKKLLILEGKGGELVETMQEEFKDQKRHSAALLAQFYLQSRDFASACHYFSVSGLKISDVMDRMETVWSIQGSKFHNNSLDFGQYLIQALTKDNMKDQEGSIALLPKTIQYFNSHIPNLLSQLILESFAVRKALMLHINACDGRKEDIQHIINAAELLNRKNHDGGYKNLEDIFALSFFQNALQRRQEAVDTINKYIAGEEQEKRVLSLIDFCVKQIEMILEDTKFGEIVRSSNGYVVLEVALTLKKNSSFSIPKLLSLFNTSEGVQPKISDDLLKICFLERLLVEKCSIDEVIPLLLELYLVNASQDHIPLEMGLGLLSYEWKKQHERFNLSRPKWIQIIIDESESDSGNSSFDFYLTKFHNLLVQSSISSPNSIVQTLKYLDPLIGKNGLCLQLIKLAITQNLEKGFQILLKENSYACVDYGRVFCKEIGDWRFLCNKMLERLTKEEENEQLKRGYEELMQYLSAHFNLQEILNIIPYNGSIGFFTPFIKSSIQINGISKVDLLIKQTVNHLLS